MSDARALLRAKRQAEETRISHPYASYTPSKQLKCNVCDVIVKHASAWEGHLGSKGHRTTLAQQRKLQQQQQQQQQRELEAAAAAASLEDHEEEEGGVQTKGKRKASVSGEDLEAKKRRTGSEVPGQMGGFPADFFSDPNRQLPVSNGDEGEEGDVNDAMAVDLTPAQQAAPQTKTAIDEEYERFQRELLSMQKAPVVENHEAFARATVVAEEQLFTEQQKSGFNLGGDGQEEKAEEETEEQKRQRKEREDRELIMDRLLEEERLQEDCDLRVASMKARVEALKKKREMRKAAKTQGKT